MTIKQFVQINQLQQADAIILRKKVLGMVDHYAVFLGFRDRKPVFVANYRDGVQVKESEMINLVAKYEPREIERFSGTESERQAAVNRGLSRLGERAYNYVANNCEHFKNWVHHGEHRSEQVKGASKAVATVGAIGVVGALATKNPKLGAWAAGLLLLGAVLNKVSEKD